MHQPILTCQAMLVQNAPALPQVPEAVQISGTNIRHLMNRASISGRPLILLDMLFLDKTFQPDCMQRTFIHIVSGCPDSNPCLVQYAMGITIRSSLPGGSSAMKLACNPPSGSNLATSSTRPDPMPSHPRPAPCRGCLPTVFPKFLSRVKAVVVNNGLLVSVPALCPCFPPPSPPPPPL